MFSDDGVGDDWPLTLSDLEPYYKLNESMMGVAGLPGNPDYGNTHRAVKRTPPIPLCRISPDGNLSHERRSREFGH